MIEPRANLNAGRPRRGYTLLELSVVVTLLGLASGLAVVKLQARLAEARLGDLLTRIEDLDARARSYAVRRGVALRIVLDHAESRIRVQQGEEALPGYEVAYDGITKTKSAWSSSAGHTNEPLTIPIDYNGVSEAYAVEVQMKTGDTTWLLMRGAGGTVQLEEGRARRFMADIAAIRPSVDAH